MQGLVQLPWWAYLLVVAALTHVTIAAVTIYLHRYQAHRAMDMHPVVAHFFRFWLWLTTGMVTCQWVAIHRKHHAYVETESDPHSPVVYGIRKVLWQGAELYKKEAGNPETVAQFGHGTPDDWLERQLYRRRESAGIALMLGIDLILFGAIGLTIWAVQMMWIPFFAAGVINGIGHWGGYRNFETADTSTNIVPFGMLIGGEELHNNHHAFASSAKFSVKPWEFDLGWVYIRMLAILRLARVKKLAPTPAVDRSKTLADLDTVSAVIANRFYIMADYARDVVRQVHREEIQRAPQQQRALLRPVRGLLMRADAMLDSHAREQLMRALSHSQALAEVYQFKLRLQEIWSQRTATPERLLEQLQEWCLQAQETGIQALEEFAESLQAYTLKPA